MSKRVAVVLSGAAARGAFQAGALQTLIPALTAEGYDLRIFLGTSAGSINAALWGQSAHLGAEAAGAEVVRTWSKMGQANVIANPLRTVVFGGTPRFLASSAGLGAGVTSLLDTTPLARTAAEVLSPAQLARNVRDGTLDAVGVVATRLPPPSRRSQREAPSFARTVVFLDSTIDVAPVADPDRNVDVAPGRIDAAHVLASSAIPIAFPPVWVPAPALHQGWYSDGGVRLNTPLRPAVALGADRLLVVSAMSTDPGRATPLAADSDPMPAIADTSAQVLHSVLGDQLTEDLATLSSVNRAVAAAASEPGARLPVRSDGSVCRAIPVMVASPEPGELGLLAQKTLTESLGSSPLSRLRSTDLYALDRLLRGLGDGPGRRELLSYVMFDERYFTAQAELGRQAAKRALAAGWSLD